MKFIESFLKEAFELACSRCELVGRSNTIKKKQVANLLFRKKHEMKKVLI